MKKLLKKLLKPIINELIEERNTSDQSNQNNIKELLEKNLEWISKLYSDGLFQPSR